MKRILLPLVTALMFTSRTNAQSVIDTVSLGAGYANQIWYSLQNDEQGSAPKNNWDIAFDVSGYGSAIHINSIIGTELWKYPHADTSGWSTVDTSGISTWPKLYNSDTSWSIGAFNQGMNNNNPFDLGWGIYNQITHNVTGDSIYIIKLSNGAYKKIWIVNLSGGTYSFKYADINGANLQNATLTKSNFTGKNFGYYSLQNNASLNREPLSANWDLLFTQYTSIYPITYTVTGILHNKGVQVAEVNNIADVATYNNWSAHSFNTAINEIGYDWKTFVAPSFVIKDSLIYFVKTVSGDIWKVVHIGFGGSSTGNFIFSKEKLSSVGIKDETGNTNAIVSIYPNPSIGGSTTIVYNFENIVTSAILNIYDLSGKIIYSEQLNNNSGLHTYNLNTTSLNAGLYIVSIDVDGRRLQQKLIIR
jgi:uncharacterized protein YjbI with pentapeptide repeats